MDQEGRPTARRERLWALFELFALVGFVVAQPTLDVLGKAPDFFLFGRAEILLLVLAVTVLPAPGLVAIGVAGGLAGGLLYASWPGLKLWLRYLAPAPLVFALVFLLVSPVSKLVLPQPGGTVDANSPGVRSNPGTRWW